MGDHRFLVAARLVAPWLIGAACAPATLAQPGDPASAGPGAPGFFNLAYCGSGRRADSTSHLYDLDWDQIARAYDLTIVQGAGPDYARFIQSLKRRDPGHQVLVYLHAHAGQPYNDRAGLLNLFETNFVHATDPASLRVIPAGEGLLVDWERDERIFYDEYDLISEMRDFTVGGYVVYRSEEGAPGTRVWPPPGADSLAFDVSVTDFLDRSVVAGHRYRYVVRTIGPLDREYSFSGEVEARAGDPPPVPFAHEQQTAIESSPGAPSYRARFRVRVDAAVRRAVLRLDRNADHDFDDQDESLPLSAPPGGEDAAEPAHGVRFPGERWVEAETRLRPADHTEFQLNIVFGFAYRLELETGDGKRLVLPERGVYTTSVNNRVRDARYGFYRMHMDAQPWQQSLLEQLDFIARRGGMVGGVFLDELLMDPAIGGDALAVDLPGRVEAEAAAGSLLAAVRAARPDLQVYYTGLGERSLAGATGGMIEGFAVGPWHRAPGGAPGLAAPPAWRGQIAAARGAIARREEVLLLARGASLGDTRARLFAFGSYLLVRAPGVRFCYMADRCIEPPLPEWGVDLGEATEPVAQAEPGVSPSGVPRHAYRRRFDRGEVWVNPEPHARERIEVGEAGFVLGLEAPGGQVGEVAWKPVARGEWLMIEPQSAVILVRGGTGGAPPTGGALPNVVPNAGGSKRESGS